MTSTIEPSSPSEPAPTDEVGANAPVKRAGVAGGIQQTGVQLGGVIGTSMLVGAIVSFAGALVALFVQRGHELEGPAAAAA